MTAALAGGNTPRRLYSALAAAPFADIVPWQGIHFFWGDERDVPPTHEENNYRAATDRMLSRVAVPAAHTHRIPTGDTTAVEAAELYQRTLAAYVPATQGLPRLDYCLLGLGEDGHTASLFPGRPTLAEKHAHRGRGSHRGARAGVFRLTVPVINNAAQITFLVTGQAKAQDRCPHPAGHGGFCVRGNAAACTAARAAHNAARWTSHVDSGRRGRQPVAPPLLSQAIPDNWKRHNREVGIPQAPSRRV